MMMNGLGTGTALASVAVVAFAAAARVVEPEHRTFPTSTNPALVFNTPKITTQRTAGLLWLGQDDGSWAMFALGHLRRFMCLALVALALALAQVVSARAEQCSDFSSERLIGSALVNNPVPGAITTVPVVVPAFSYAVGDRFRFRLEITNSTEFAAIRDVGIFVSTDTAQIKRTSVEADAISNGQTRSASFAPVSAAVVRPELTVFVGANDYTFAFGGPNIVTNEVYQVFMQCQPAAAPLVTVTSSNANALSGDAVTLTASVTVGAGTPTGSVEFFDGTTSLGSATLFSGAASLTTNTLAVGPHRITVRYSGDGSFPAAQSIGFLQTIRAVSDTQVSFGIGTAFARQCETFGFVLVSSTAAGPPPGSVSILDGTRLITTMTLGPDSVLNPNSSRTSGLLPVLRDTRVVTARYSGAPGYNASEATLTLQDNFVPVTAVTVTSSTNQTNAGEAVTFTAEVSIDDSRFAADTFFGGTVEFFDGTILIHTSEVSAGAGSFSVNFITSTLSQGNHNITARFKGLDAAAVCATDSVSEALAHLVVGTDAETTTTVTSPENPALLGSPVTFTATVAAAAGTPGGTVEFFDGATSLGTATLAAGSASLTTSALAAGIHTITAVYSGGAGFSGSTSSPLVQNIASPALATTTTIESSLNPSVFGQPVTFTVTVAAASGTPTGNVTFLDGTTPLQTDALANGVATFTTTTLTAGSHTITAQYAGAAGFVASVSDPLVQQVNQPANDHSARLDRVQEKGSAAVASLSEEFLTDTTASAMSDALSGNVQVISGAENGMTIQYAPGMDAVVSPTSSMPGAITSDSAFRFWASLRAADWNAADLDGDQVNALVGASVLFGDGMVAGLAAGYEAFDFVDDANADLDGHGYTLGAYVGGRLTSDLLLDAQLHHTWLDYDVASGPVSGAFDANRLVASGGLTYNYVNGAFTLSPGVRATGTWEWQDGYTDSAAVAHDSRHFHFGRASASAVASYRFDIGEGMTLTPSLGVHADYRFYGGDFIDDVSLEGLTGRLSGAVDLTAKGGTRLGVTVEVMGFGAKTSTLSQSIRANLSVPF